MMLATKFFSLLFGRSPEYEDILTSKAEFFQMGMWMPVRPLVQKHAVCLLGFTILFLSKFAF